MNLKTGEPMPEILRNSLNHILEKRDYTLISSQKDIGPDNVIGNLLGGSKVTKENMNTIYKMMEYGMAKCDKHIKLYVQLKNIINMYNTKKA